ncbi:MAG: hypothetical protein ACPKPY_13270 [Nitrososphaeraceae archaeon]
MDYFEMDRVISELVRSYAAPSATTWFKLSLNKSPSAFEYRNKVIDFIKHFENILLCYPSNPRTDIFRKYVKSELRKEIKNINLGNNKEVERRYQYYVNYN